MEFRFDTAENLMDDTNIFADITNNFSSLKLRYVNFQNFALRHDTSYVHPEIMNFFQELISYYIIKKNTHRIRECLLKFLLVV